ncbi:MAG: GGDEF domain-containing protein [Terracidiphilus sp.]
MKRLLSILVLFLGGAASGWPAAPATLTNLQAIHALTNAEASRAIPVDFEATVTYFRNHEADLFVEDGGEAIYVAAYGQTEMSLRYGDRVRIEGTTQNSFRPIVIAKRITVLSHGVPPSPVPASAQQLFSSQVDSMRVSVRGVVKSAEMVWTLHERNIYLQVLIDGGYIDAAVNSHDESALKGLVDAEVEITGVVNAKFDQKMQQVGTVLDVQNLEDVKVLRRADSSPEALPVTPMDQVLSGYFVRDLSQRIRVKGTVTYYQQGSAVMLQSGAKSLWVMTITDVPLRVGDVAYASGFPDVRNGYLVLTHGQVQDTQEYAPITPTEVDWETLTSGRNAFDLVSVEGLVRTEAREATQDEYVLMTPGKHLVSVIYRHPDSADDAPLPAMKFVPIGSKIRVTGISMFYRTDPFNGPVASDLLIRNFDDVEVVAGPPLTTVTNLARLVGVLLVLLFLAGLRAWFSERKVRHQNAEVAYIERRRSGILEDINGSLPLAEIIERITELVSFKLRGVPCWCQIAGGAKLGNCPENLTAFRIVQEPVHSRTGPALGVVCAAFDPLINPRAIESETLSGAAGLAKLAIESRKLYSDLLRRSEFDLLTDIHNRFSLEKHLDAQIEKSRREASIFGLIYVDLDDFKLVNDLHGHRIGDVFLQEVTERMKHQLRPHDLLARLGGDEFAVLVSAVHSRAEVEEIVHRLEGSLSGAMKIEGVVLRASASFGIAIYPEDGTTKDSLLSAGDAAMYVAKRMKHETQ